jgi:peptide/nickel transport system substrate-binding protein
MEHAPAGRAGLLALAYKSGEAWNETAFANAEFDAALGEALSISDAEKRKVMERIEKIMQDEGVMIQPYWRSLYRHYDAEGQRLRTCTR